MSTSRTWIVVRSRPVGGLGLPPYSVLSECQTYFTEADRACSAGTVPFLWGQRCGNFAALLVCVVGGDQGRSATPYSACDTVDLRLLQKRKSARTSADHDWGGRC